MKPSTQLIVAAVFVILLAAGIILVNGKVIQPASTPTPTERPKFLEGTQATDITKIKVTDNVKKTSFTAERGKDGKWTITEGDKSKDKGLGVDEGRIDNALALLPNVIPSSSFSSQDLAAFKLDNPPYTLALTINTNTLTLQIGSLNPDGTDYYVQRADGKDVYLIGNYNLQPFIDFITDPPYVQPTPNPNATPSPSATPSPAATSTPAVTSTPAGPSTPEPTGTPY